MADTKRQYVLGESARLEGAFYNASDPTVLTDPSTITLIVTKPDSSTDTFTFAGGQLTKLAVGIYYRDYVPATKGVYSFRFTGTGTFPATGTSEFVVI